MASAAYIMKNCKISHTDNVFHYVVVANDGRDLKDVFLTPDEVKEIPEYAGLQAISPIQYWNLKEYGKITSI